MTRTVFAIVVAVSISIPSMARPQALELPALEIRLENYLRAAAFDDDTTPILNNRMSSGGLRFADGQTGLDGFLATYPLRFYGMERYEMSHLEMALEGIGPAMTMGMLLGAVGTTTGMFDEDSAWYLAGGMAALGALMGVRKGATDPSWRIRYRWTPPPGHDGEDQLHGPDHR
jgi:hypothetical protein